MLPHQPALLVYNLNMTRGYWSTALLLSATTIGAGIFAIPYVSAKVGYPLGLLWLIVAGLIMVSVNYAYTEIVMRTGANKPMQLVGYGELYLGRVGRAMGMVIILVGQWGAILAYIIGIGGFLSIIFGTVGKGTDTFFSLFIICIVAGITWFNIKFVNSLEVFLTVSMVFIIVVIFLFSFQHINVTHYLGVYPFPSIVDAFLPYGVMIGAMSGFAVIPEVVRVSRIHMLSQRQLYSAIGVGTVIPILCYVIFQYAVVGVSGPNTTQEAMQGLLFLIDPAIVRLGALLGIFAMVSSYLTLTYVLKDTFTHDFNVSRLRAHVFSILPPVVMYLVGVRSFLVALEVVGVWLGTTSIVFIAVLYRKSLQKEDYFKGY